MAKISIVIPCYFNEQNIPVTTKELISNEELFPSGTEFEYILVDDGSEDNTYQELLKFKEKYELPFSLLSDEQKEDSSLKMYIFCIKNRLRQK